MFKERRTLLLIPSILNQAGLGARKMQRASAGFKKMFSCRLLRINLCFCKDLANYEKLCCCRAERSCSVT